MSLSEETNVLSVKENILTITLEMGIKLIIDMDDDFSYKRYTGKLEIKTDSKTFTIDVFKVFKYSDDNVEIKIKLSSSSLTEYVKLFDLIENKYLAYRDDYGKEDKVKTNISHFNFDSYDLTKKALELIDEYVKILLSYKREDLSDILNIVHEKDQIIKKYSSSEIVHFIIIKILDLVDKPGYNITYDVLNEKFSRYI